MKIQLHYAASSLELFDARLSHAFLRRLRSRSRTLGLMIAVPGGITAKDAEQIARMRSMALMHASS